MKKIIGLWCLFLFVSCAIQDQVIDKSVVKEFDLDQYLGQWYEIARYDHKFEKDMVGVTATYSLEKEGRIKVVNKGFKKTVDGEESIAIGKAKIPNSNEPSKLKVSFFWFFYGDYYVLELDKEYKWAAIGSKSDDYLWILSRTPELEKNTYDTILKLLHQRGYDIDKLIKVKQRNK
ncbi:outer membrane lipoprotein Blc [Flavobacteriaceae bacterium UJ101]|nr:outer membrane lipoprotein Blc [Flavobacteriaceae bacterium UJ101]